MILVPQARSVASGYPSDRQLRRLVLFIHCFFIQYISYMVYRELLPDDVSM